MFIGRLYHVILSNEFIGNCRVLAYEMRLPRDYVIASFVIGNTFSWSSRQPACLSIIEERRDETGLLRLYSYGNNVIQVFMEYRYLDKQYTMER